MSDPLQRPSAEEARERRLFEIRHEAEKKGRVEAIGIRPQGAPFPVASPETGYYGVPLLKEPPWTWQIPPYFFLGGAAGSAAMIGLAARWVGGDARLARDCRYLAAAGAAGSAGLLIADLGRPMRFLNMLRIVKPQSPMSVGAWTLAVFGTFSVAAAFAETLNRSLNSVPIQMIGNVSETISALAGLPFSNYTGVLIGASVIPLWNQNAATLPIHFGMSGLNSAVSILELMGNENPALNTLGMGGSAVECLEGLNVELSKNPAMEPLRCGRSGWLTRIGGVLSGPVPLALRVAAAFVNQRRSCQLRRIAAASSVAGSMLTRFAWVHAGHVSAQDWRTPLGIAPTQGRAGQPKEMPIRCSDPTAEPPMRVEGVPL